MDVSLSPVFDGSINISIEHAADGGFNLIWDDGVANSFEETYPLLSTALARAAALAACMESDWEKGFMADPEVFTERVTTFMDEEALA